MLARILFCCASLAACSAPYAASDAIPAHDPPPRAPPADGKNTPSVKDDAGPCGLSACTVQVSAGDAFACALDDKGVVRCWGKNDLGQTSASDPKASGAPHAVEGLGTTKQLATGAAHACALDDGGIVRCWGDDSNGIVSGAPSTVSRPMPAVVKGLPGKIVSIAAASESQCAIDDANALYCWGANDYGQLGVAGTGTKPPKSVASPVKVLDDVVHVGATVDTICVIKRTGAVSCLGNDFSGQLGQGKSDLDPHPTPVDVHGMQGLPAQIAVGMGWHVAVTLDNGRVASWGSNARSAIVHAQNVYTVESPTLVAGVDDVAEVAAGGYFSCARKKSGAVACWGDATTGLVGAAHDGGAAPTAIANLPAAQQITAGRSGFACIVSAGKTFCWGANGSGQLGRGTVGPSSSTPAEAKL